MSMDLNAVAVHNGSFLGIENSFESSKIVLFPLPWDVTTSYRAGTRSGPQHIIEASYQLDLFSHFLSKAWETPFHTLENSEEWLAKSAALRNSVESYVAFLESGKSLNDDSQMKKTVSELNLACDEFFAWALKNCESFVEQGKIPVIVGGDHSVTYAPVKALSGKYKDLSVLHFDAHADLRIRYEGFEHSHASIMNRLLRENAIHKLVQVGIRDFCPEELSQIENDGRIKTYFDRDLKQRRFEGQNFKQTAREIIDQLSSRVYVSFDIDGLDPKLCPDTGTPVPGGLEFDEARYLIEELARSGRQIVGGDIVEVAPSIDLDNEWNGNVGARMLWTLVQAIEFSRRLHNS